MKLSMWMIANRLSSLDMDLDIRDDAPAVLNSARQAYATNCVHVYREGNSVICSGEGSTIRIHNMDVVQGFEIIQSVFDYFQDWSDDMVRLVRERNYQGAIDLACQVFHNPILLQDGNSRVLGISQKLYPADSLDAEWAYLCKYGYSSLNAIQQMRYDYPNIEFWHHGTQTFRFSDDFLSYSGVSYCLYCNDVICGRITLLEKDRPLNTGDCQLLEQLAAILEPGLGQIYYESVLNNTNVFHNILFGDPYDKKLLDTQLAYLQWQSEDTYYLTAVEVQDISGRKTRDENVDLLMQVILRQTTNYVVMKKRACILLLANRNLSKDAQMLTFLKKLQARNPIKIGFSLPCRGLENAGHMYEQAGYAIASGKDAMPQEICHHFFDYAVNFIIESGNLSHSVRACMPTVVKLWEMQQVNGDELFHTLKVFLDNERSVSRTSEALFTHRNTVLYRIRKIREILNRDLDDAYIREYCRLSIRILELYRHKSNRL